MSAYIPTLKRYYREVVVPEILKSGKFSNIHQVPKLLKISLNSGIDAEADKNQVADVLRDLSNIAGQKAVVTRARKAVSNFKLKEGQPVGARVTLRGDAMWDFLHRLVAVALPTIRDFRGLSPKLDGQGNYNLGVQDFSIFPEIVLENVKRSMGFDVTLVTSAKNDEDGRELLRLLGLPFRRTEPVTKPKAA